MSMQVRPDGAYRRVVVTLDGSPLAETAVPYALAQARAFAAELVLLQVIPTLLPVARPSTAIGSVGAPEPSDDTGDDERAAMTYLRAVADNMRGHDVTVTYRVRRGPIVSAILQEAEAAHADLLVMTTHGASALPRLVVGSVANQIVSRAPCPVLLIRAGVATTIMEGGVRSFEDDAAHYGLLIQRSLGVRTVALDRIVGSVGRANSLGPDFLPPSRQRNGRYRGIRAAMERGEILPPVDLYKLGYAYYVLDGNHRVAAAKALGQKDIDAVVTEYLQAEDADAHRAYLERRLFEQATGLTRVGATRPGHYPRLEELIRAYGQSQGIDDLREAAQRWYTRVYRPLAVKLRAAQLTRLFPGERTADLFVHLSDLRAREEARQHRAVSYGEALRAMLARYRGGRQASRTSLSGLRRLLPGSKQTPTTDV